MSADPIDEVSQQTRQTLIALSEVIRQLAARQTRRDEQRVQAAQAALSHRPATATQRPTGSEVDTLESTQRRHVHARR